MSLPRIIQSGKDTSHYTNYIMYSQHLKSAMYHAFKHSSKEYYSNLKLDCEQECVKLPGNKLIICLDEEKVSETEYYEILAKKQFFNNLAAIIKSYFEGMPRPDIKDDLNRELVEVYLDYYLSFYDLVWFAWKDLKHEIPLIYEEWEISTPGNVLKLAMCQELSETDKGGTLSDIYKGWYLVEKVKNGRVLNLKQQTELRRIQKRIEKRTGKKVKDFIKNIPEVVLDCLKSNSNNRIKSKIRIFKQKQAEKMAIHIKGIKRKIR